MSFSFRFSPLERLRAVWQELAGEVTTAPKLFILAALAILIRLLFMGQMQLLPEESYYWNYSQHLGLGYLDHPPMVSWLDSVFGAVFGRSEFVVRLPAFLSWFIMTFFVFRLAQNLYNRAVAGRVIVLLAVLPIYFSVGFLMTPDAPLYAAWAGCLYFLERALIGKKNRAWMGVGICLGLGLLSKYTMGLLVPATLVFILMDPASRRWLRRPQSYGAALIALIIFLPVIYWNFTHDWASFAFQGSRRWSGGGNFQLHILIGSILILLTPLGFMEAVRCLRDGWKRQRTEFHRQKDSHRKTRFMLVFALVPLAVFVIHSLQGQPKLNWTGVVWISMLPMIASRMLLATRESVGRMSRFVYRAWPATLVFLLVFYTAGFGYIVGGLPGWHSMIGMPVPAGWQELGARVEQLEVDLENSTKSEPIIIGLDKYWIASQLSFYDPADDDALPEFTAENVFGGNGLMWNYWVPPDSIQGRNALLISFNENKLSGSQITTHFASMGPIHAEKISRRGKAISSFYWRVGYLYSGTAHL